MPRIAPHHHPCNVCKAKVECGGTWEQNYDGWPEVICPEYHGSGAGVPEFLCEACSEAADRQLAADIAENV